ncbi:MAG: hypothetical protein FWE11_07035 [Defluviitaleaceae bacterium]|nr:hypothetical protein [Defluviitaleaceae bacterium]
MAAVLDTTVQIDRIFGSTDRKSRIRDMMANNECYSTQYVLGEYYATIVRDCTMIYSIVAQNDDIYEAEKKINEKAFGRSKDRAHKIFIFLRELFGNDMDYIKMHMESFFDLLIQKFYKGINKKLLSGSMCNRANARIEYIEGCPKLRNLNCRKTDNHCDISSLWKNNFSKIDQLKYDYNITERTKNALLQSSAINPPKGNACRTLGDCIICLETIDGNVDSVCTTNRDDFKPITDCLGLELIVPNYKK